MNAQALNYHSDSWQTIEEYIEMDNRLENEYRHQEAVKAARIELRKLDYEFANELAEVMWLQEIIEAKALEMLREYGWDTESQVRQHYLNADEILFTDSGDF